MAPAKKESKNTQQGATANLRVKKPKNFYSSLTEWWRKEHETLGKRPGVAAVRQWYEENAHTVWSEKQRPSLKEVEVAAKGLRTLENAKAYSRAYRIGCKEREVARADVGDDIQDDNDGASMDTDQSPSVPQAVPQALQTVSPPVAATLQPATTAANVTPARPAPQHGPACWPASTVASAYTPSTVNIAGGTIPRDCSPHAPTDAPFTAAPVPAVPRTPSPNRHELSQADLHLHHLPNLHHPVRYQQQQQQQKQRQQHPYPHPQPIPFPPPTTRLVRRQAEVHWYPPATAEATWCGPAAVDMALPFHPAHSGRPAVYQSGIARGSVVHAVPPPQSIYMGYPGFAAAASWCQPGCPCPEPVHGSNSSSGLGPVTPTRTLAPHRQSQPLYGIRQSVAAPSCPAESSYPAPAHSSGLFGPALTPAPTSSSAACLPYTALPAPHMAAAAAVPAAAPATAPAAAAAALEVTEEEAQEFMDRLLSNIDADFSFAPAPLSVEGPQQQPQVVPEWVEVEVDGFRDGLLSAAQEAVGDSYWEGAQQRLLGL